MCKIYPAAFSRFFVAIVLLIPFAFGSAQASVIGQQNSTVTFFDATTGLVDFSFDSNSPYTIREQDFSLDASSLFSASGQLIGTFYEFVIPNFYDPLPLKKLNITMDGGNSSASGFALPTVISVRGFDSEYGVPAPAVPVEGVFISGSTSPLQVTEYWEMYPNPDIETVNIFVPDAFNLQSIMIETQSIPLPASVWLFGTGLLGLVGIARRSLGRSPVN